MLNIPQIRGRFKENFPLIFHLIKDRIHYLCIKEVYFMPIIEINSLDYVGVEVFARLERIEIKKGYSLSKTN